MKPHRSLTLAWLLLLASSTVHAQESYPSKPVRIVVDSAAGSANDATARILAEKLGKLLI